MKKIVLMLFAMVVAMPIVANAFDRNQCEKRTFVLTAYYSPLENQKFYYKETFLEEKILNGEGKYGASGKAVFNGMLAAPSSYEFEGKIYFPGLGIGEVADRGGAIVEAGVRNFESDRIDIWMGYGEEGLVRALDFGVQSLEGYYCDAATLKTLNTSDVNVGFDMGQVPIFKNFFDLAIWKQQLNPGRKDVWVYYLQKYLVKLGYLSDNKQTGYFGPETQKALCNYQTKKNISNSSYSDCGVFGPKTRYAMKTDVENKGLLPADLWAVTNIDAIKKQAVDWNEAEKIIVSLQKSNEFFDQPMYRNVYDIKTQSLQELLKYLGFYEGEVTGVYDAKTVEAVHQYQLDRGLLIGYENNPEVWGYFGPATRAACNADLDKKHEDENNAALHKLLEEPVVQKSVFQFYRPYEKNEGPNEEIRILQRFLIDLGLYSNEVNGVFDKPTIDALFDFQVKYGLLEADADLVLRGYLGPGTRDRINRMLAF